MTAPQLVTTEPNNISSYTGCRLRTLLSRCERSIHSEVFLNRALSSYINICSPHDGLEGFPEFFCGIVSSYHDICMHHLYVKPMPLIQNQLSSALQTYRTEIGSAFCAAMAASTGMLLRDEYRSEGTHGLVSFVAYLKACEAKANLVTAFTYPRLTDCHMMPLGLAGVREHGTASEMRQMSDDDVTVVNQLATAFRYGYPDHAIPKDPSLCMQLYTLSSEASSADAMFELATMYSSGEGGLPRDVHRAVHLYCGAIARGKPHAEHNLAVLLMHGDMEAGLAADVAQAARFYKNAASKGDVSAMRALVQLYSCGGHSVKRDWVQRIRYMRQLVEAGDDDYSYTVAKLLSKGSPEYGVERDSVRAVRLYERAAQSGCRDSMLMLADLYSKGDEAVATDRRKAFRFYSMAAQAGNYDALNNLAQFYIMGDEEAGVGKDVEQGIAILKRGIVAGDVDAMINLANLHAGALPGIEQDMWTALRLFEQAEKRGSAHALYRQAFIYWKGCESAGIRKDVGRSIELLKRAAEAYHPDAQKVLEECLEEMSA